MKTLSLRRSDKVANSRSYDHKIEFGSWWILPLVIVAGLTVYFIYKEDEPVNQLSVSSTSQTPAAETATAEKQFPEEYVTGQIKMRRNFVNEIIIEGSLRNIATSTNYKDAVLRVDFISRAGEVLFTKDYPVNEILTPNSAANYKFKNPPSVDVDRIIGKVLKVEVCE